MESKLENKNFTLFQECPLGPVKLKNRSIRAAAFEGMCPNGQPSESLLRFHEDRARGGVGMTTVAYVSVSEDGRSFNHQAHMNQAAVSIPLVYVGGLLSLNKIQEVFNKGFEFVSMARALFIEPNFVNKLKDQQSSVSTCEPSNKCMATMYSGEAVCLKLEEMENPYTNG